MPHTWDPERYLTYADERGRPFVELVGRIDSAAPSTVVDLGCGPGNLTALLGERWPGAVVRGLDSSAQMIEKARASVAGVDFEVADLRSWAESAEPVDVLVSNATLQWVPGHLDLLPALVGRVVPGGWFAFQVPGNFEQPSHVIRTELAAEAAYAEHTQGAAVPSSHDPVAYLEALAALGCVVDAWETTYLHVLTGPDPVFTWVSGTGARPTLQALPGDLRASFEEEFKRRLRAAYPEKGGRVVLPFRRIFVVAKVPKRRRLVIRLHHVQVACPPGGEDGARRFYAGALGLTEVEKPAALRGRGGAWFRSYDALGAVGAEVHVGVEAPFVAARKAHPAFVVDDLAAVAGAVVRAGFEVDESERASFEGYLRFHTHDAAGNRIEVLQLLPPRSP